MRRVLALVALLLATFPALAADKWCGYTALGDAINASGINKSYPTAAEAIAACQSVPAVTYSATSAGWGARQARVCKLDEAAKKVVLTATATTSSHSSDCGKEIPTSGETKFVGWAITTDCSSTEEKWLRVNLSRTPWTANNCNGGCGYTASPIADRCTIIEAGPGVPNIHVGQNCWYNAKPTGKVCTNDPTDPPPPENPPPEPPKECGKGKVRLPNGTCGDVGDCPVGQHVVNGKCTPDGVCPTGKVKAPDGSCVDEKCPAGQARGSDGSCKKDGDGDGNPDDGEDTGKFSGGEDCKTPPACSGDNILCGQARIQWRIDCNTRRNETITGGMACASPPICAGEKCNAMEYSQLLQQWRTACATETLARGTPAGGGDQPNWTKVTGDGSGGAGPEPTGVTRVVGQGIQGRLDSTGFLNGSGSCPKLGVIQSQTFGNYDLDEMPWLCDLLTITRWILKLVGAFIALGILLGWRLG